MQIGIYNSYIYPKTHLYSYRTPVESKQKCDISFCGQDILRLPKYKILEYINKSINKENLLGEGREASVYRIVDTDYCARIKDEAVSIGPNTLLSFNLSEEDKINHIVAKLDNGSTILKYIEGLPVFAREEDIEKSLKIKNAVISAPISSFQKLLNQIAYAKDKDMIFDCCGANVIINPKTKEITAIDFYKNSLENPEVVRPLSAMYAAFVTSFDDLNYRRVCANKILSAGINEISNSKDLCLSIGEFDFSNLLYKLKLDGLIDNNSYYNLLRNIFQDIQNLKLQEIRGKNVANELNGRVKLAKALVKQIF